MAADATDAGGGGTNVPAPPKPDGEAVLRAVEAYLTVAYGGHDDWPVTVRSQVAVLRGWKGDFFRSPAIAPDRDDPTRRYTIRLGNRHYPHMKLAIERSPDATRYLFKVDTHDGHVLPPPDATEYPAFRTLMEDNQRMAQSIEALWAEQDLPTFKTYLREDLARRQAAKG